MKIKFILPANKQVNKLFSPPVNLPLLTALTPPDVEIDIIDENATPLDIDYLSKDVDLIGITSVTSTINRAYQIADQFRSRGVPVIIGGIHASVLPDEAIWHADSVVIGEADHLWIKIVNDYKNNSSQKYYKQNQFSNLEKLPILRRNRLTIPSGKYLVPYAIHTVRGCPHHCSFCGITSFYGNTYRVRPIREIINEIEGNDIRIFSFADGNTAGNISHAKKLLKELIPLKASWVAPVTINVAKDDEFLQLASAAGCIGFLIGFESVLASSLKEAHKFTNKVEDYEKATRKIQRHNIPIIGSFVFGFDNDDKDIFDKTIEFIIENKIDIPLFSILTPLPGTPLYVQLLKDNRIIETDWNLYDLNHVVFRPRLMSESELYEGFIKAWEEVYSSEQIYERVINIVERAAQNDDLRIKFKNNLRFTLNLNFSIKENG